jgi:hypothetical protein
MLIKYLRTKLVFETLAVFSDHRFAFIGSREIRSSLPATHAQARFPCLGTVLQGFATEAANFDRVVAEYHAVRNWIAESAKKNIGKTASRLFTSNDWNRDYSFSV